MARHSLRPGDFVIEIVHYTQKSVPVDVLFSRLRALPWPDDRLVAAGVSLQ